MALRIGGDFMFPSQSYRELQQASGTHHKIQFSKLVIDTSLVLFSVSKNSEP